MLRALEYVRSALPYWNASGGRDHVWTMLHDEGPCFCPRALRPSILLTHYGYYAAKPRPWGTFADDNFLLDRGFYARHLGDPAAPTPCFERGKDLVIPPWKPPTFWKRALRDAALAAAATPIASLAAAPTDAAAAAPTDAASAAAPAAAPAAELPAPQRRPKLVFFAGDLGFNRLGGYSRDLRQVGVRVRVRVRIRVRVRVGVRVRVRVRARARS
jgi:hypothetical protein